MNRHNLQLLARWLRQTANAIEGVCGDTERPSELDKALDKAINFDAGTALGAGLPSEASDILDRPIISVAGVRLAQSCAKAGIRTVRQVLEMTEDDLDDLHNVGPSSIDALKAHLYAYGLALKPSDGKHN